MGLGPNVFSIQNNDSGQLVASPSHIAAYSTPRTMASAGHLEELTLADIVVARCLCPTCPCSPLVAFASRRRHPSHTGGDSVDHPHLWPVAFEHESVISLMVLSPGQSATDLTLIKLFGVGLKFGSSNFLVEPLSPHISSAFIS